MAAEAEAVILQIHSMEITANIISSVLNPFLFIAVTSCLPVAIVFHCSAYTISHHYERNGKRGPVFTCFSHKT